MADDLRVPVSNLVRTVLEDAFSVVEKMTDNVGDLLEDVVDEAEAARDRIRRRHRHRRQRRSVRTERSDPEPGESEIDETPESTSEPLSEPEVLGWQPLFLARAGHCAECGTGLARGSQAYASVSRQGVGSTTLCEPCMHAQGA